MTLMERGVRMNGNGATKGAGRRKGEGKGERMLGCKKTCAREESKELNGSLFVRSCTCAFMSASLPGLCTTYLQ